MKHGHAEIGQYEILTVFLINVYSGIKEHDMDLSKDDTLCLVFIIDIGTKGYNRTLHIVTSKGFVDRRHFS